MHLQVQIQEACGTASQHIGILKYQYNKAEGSWTDTGTTLTINTDQNTTYQFRSIDKAGNVSQTTENYRIQKDSIKPVINGISNSNVTETSFRININATDALSGIKKIEYSIDGGNTYAVGNTDTANYKDFTGIAGGKNYNSKVRVTDNAGNQVEKENTSLHIHGVSCYSTQCRGTFAHQSNQSIPYYICTHTHSAVGSLESGNALSDEAYYLSSGGCYTRANNYNCTRTMKVTGAISYTTINKAYTSCHNVRPLCAEKFTAKCDLCGIQKNVVIQGSLWWCPKCNKYILTQDGKAADYTYIGMPYGICNEPKIRYGANCGMSSGYVEYKKTVEYYKCNTCGKETTYHNSASSYCNICKNTHAIGASGERSTTHNTVEKYLICGN